MPPGGETQARRFYAELLGIPEVPKPTHLARRGGCWFERGDLKIHLGVAPNFHPARKAHAGLLVNDLAALIEHLADNGHPARPDEPLPGYIRAYVDDPFGNRLELLQAAAIEGI